MNKAIDIVTGVEYTFDNAEDLRLALQADWGQPVDHIEPRVENLNPAYLYVCPYAADVRGLTVVCASSSYAGAREDAYQRAQDI